MNKVQLQSTDGATVEVYDLGAHIASWQVGGAERLYLSPNSELDGVAAIRGGVPIIFPQFGKEGALPRHGFARTARWRLVSQQSNDQSELGLTSAAFQFKGDASTTALWQHKFEVNLLVQFAKDELHIRLHVKNTDTTSFAFTCALHTYLQVTDINRVRVHGLKDTSYRVSGADKADVRFDTEEFLRIDREVDRIYLNARDKLIVSEPDRITEVRKQGFADCVVWNPWAEKCAQLRDMPADGYLKMLCIEAAQVSEPIELAPDASWTGEQMLVAVL